LIPLALLLALIAPTAERYQSASREIMQPCRKDTVIPVIYEIPGSQRKTPTLIDLVSKKRPMFAYEQEVRVVKIIEEGNWELLRPETLGLPLDWDPETNLELIQVHPEADHAFMQTVMAEVEHHAPALKSRIEWSAMKLRPPF
jgi:hypothetical protein